ncbi:uncharacterized protein [Spinacia oleracea]|uniref:Uncharacterized protein isoform X2 n=1 Tax=Spinacia oleracea TaxID=3562 RepID=A0ABM3QW33_SPIOL|nr:uncharacterized protein LOC110800729 isoform X2 [Spinacia oleracea]
MTGGQDDRPLCSPDDQGIPRLRVLQTRMIFPHSRKEYFHNWTGNRVTCHDWFQQSLKEGLTVFRDQDLGSMAHQVRPHSHIKDQDDGLDRIANED